MRHLSIFFLLGMVAFFGGRSAHAAMVICVPVNPADSWVKKITINTSSKRVMLGVEALRTASGSTLTNLDAVLEESDETAPMYAFNAYPRPGGEVTNLFKLFKAMSEWRLINAGIVFVGNKPTLRALDSSQPYNCSKR